MVLPALCSFPRGPQVDEQLKEYVTTHQRKLALELMQKSVGFGWGNASGTSRNGATLKGFI